MKELQEILQRVGKMTDTDEAVLATVVDVKGSGYRLAGARMLLDRNGTTIGTVSGGCLEADVIERANRLPDNAAPRVITYDTTNDDKSVFGLGMGCRGVVRILLERAAANESLAYITGRHKLRERAAIATLIDKTNGVKLPIASRFYYPGNGAEQNIDEGFEQIKKTLTQLADDASAAIGIDRSFAKSYKTPDGDLEFFIEVINPPTSILIFGAGHDAPPLANFARQLGWHVSIIDHRSAWAVQERFSPDDRIFVSRPDALGDQLFSDIDSVAVVMSHNYESDREALHRLLNSKCRYIGALGPKDRTLALLDELANAGRTFDRERLDVLYSPAGLDIGATTPEGIALSIIAEIQTVLSARDGSFLRDRQGSIYDR